jgi:hypothetical protein
VAIVQISRITNRKGLEVDLPQPLAGAELGWATDERRLYIGNGELADGAPVIGNTEILTEFSDILAFTTAYTYRGEAAGYVVQTGPTSGDPVTQSLQSRLDSYAVVTDFGATGDGITDDTAAINRALYQLYCVQSNPQIRRSLFFPAGVYIVTSPILVPPYATLYGDGVNGSIISLTVQAWTSAVSYQAGVLVDDNNVYYRALIDVPVGTSISDTTYWAEEAQPTCIAQTCDNQQQTGSSIGSNGATPPQSISITNMEFTTNLEIDGFLVESAVNCSFNNVSFQGVLTTSIIQEYATEPLVNAGDFIVGRVYVIATLGSTDWNEAAGTSGVTYNVGDGFEAYTVGDGNGTANLVPIQTVGLTWKSTLAYICSSITVNACQFNGFWWGAQTAYQTKGITISNSSFDTLYQGVVLGGPSGVVNGGPTGFKILHNTFDNIYYQGIFSGGAVSLNASGYNVFYDVGNGFDGVDYPISVIIDFGDNNNVSVGDMFERTDTIAESNNLPQIDINDTTSIATVNGTTLLLGTYTRQSGLKETLTDNTTDVLFTVNAAYIRAFNFDYTIVRATTTRTGTFTVVASTDGTGGDLVYNDSGYQNASTGVTFVATESAGVVSVSYTTTSTGQVAFLNYSVTKLA